MATTINRHDTHSTTAEGAWSTKRIAVTALFCAVSAICTLFISFPIIPGVTFLKYDPSGISALIAGFAYGPTTGLIVSILPYLIHLGTEGGVYGTIMAILATASLTLPASLVYQRKPTMSGAILGMAIGAVVCLACCILGNLIVTPIYMGAPREAVVAMIVPALLPFNLLKILINCVVTFFVYKPISKALED